MEWRHGAGSVQERFETKARRYVFFSMVEWAQKKKIRESRLSLELHTYGVVFICNNAKIISWCKVAAIWD